MPPFSIFESMPVEIEAAEFIHGQPGDFVAAAGEVFGGVAAKAAAAAGDKGDLRFGGHHGILGDDDGLEIDRQGLRRLPVSPRVLPDPPDCIGCGLAGPDGVVQSENSVTRRERGRHGP